MSYEYENLNDVRRVIEDVFENEIVSFVHKKEGRSDLSKAYKAYYEKMISIAQNGDDYIGLNELYGVWDHDDHVPDALSWFCSDICPLLDSVTVFFDEDGNIFDENSIGWARKTLEEGSVVYKGETFTKKDVALAFKPSPLFRRLIEND